jgi:RNA polymerase sigma-70 factor, ECF subfamily
VAVRDASAFDDFYAASVRRLTSQVYAMAGDLSEAEDAVQEAFARAWQHWGRVSGYADPEGWVRTVACRICVSSWRKAVNRSSAQRRQAAGADLPGLSPDYVAIVAALRQIPAAQRQAIVLHHLVGLPVEEIARQTRTPVGTVKARLARGRRALQPLLADGTSVVAQAAEGVISDA